MIALLLSVLLLLPMYPAYADKLDLGVNLGTEIAGTEVISAEIRLEQIDKLQEEIIKSIQDVRYELYDANVPYTKDKTLQEVVSDLGLTKAQYVMGLSWDQDVEKMAILRASEVALLDGASHNRLTEETIMTVSKGSKRLATESVSAGFASIRDNVYGAWGMDQKQALIDAKGTFSSKNGDLYAILNPNYKSIGFAKATAGGKVLSVLCFSKAEATDTQVTGYEGTFQIDLLAVSSDLGKEEEVKETEEIPFAIEEKESNSLAKGVKKVDRKGVKGIKTITKKRTPYKDFYVNIQQNEEITKEPVSEIVLVGNNEELANKKLSGNLTSSIFVRPAIDSLEKLGILSKGEYVEGEVVGSWLKIDYEGKEAYIAKAFVKEEERKEEKLSGYLSSNLFVRPAKGSQDKLGILSKGEYVEGVVDGAWLKFSYNGQTAYIAKSFVKANPKLIEESLSGYLISNLYVRPAKNSDQKIGIINKGNFVEGVVDGAWLKFTYEGQEAYIAKKFVQADLKGILTSDIFVRPEKNSSVKLGILKKGEKVTGKVDGAWMKIEWSNGYAYIANKFVEF